MSKKIKSVEKMSLRETEAVSLRYSVNRKLGGVKRLLDDSMMYKRNIVVSDGVSTLVIENDNEMIAVYQYIMQESDIYKYINRCELSCTGEKLPHEDDYPPLNYFKT